MDYGVAWQAKEPYGSGGSAPTVAPAPPYVTSSESSSGVEPTYSGNSAYDPHLLTAQCTHPGQKENDSGLGVGGFEAEGREERSTDSVATFHVTSDPSGMVECEPPPVHRRSLVVSEMRPLRIECFGKLHGPYIAP